MPDGARDSSPSEPSSDGRTAAFHGKNFGLLFERTIVVLCKQGGFIVGLPGDSASTFSNAAEVSVSIFLHPTFR